MAPAASPSTRASSPARADNRMHGMSAHGGIGAQLAQQRESIEAGHHHVGQHQVGRLTARGFESRLSVRHPLNVPAACAKQTGDVVAHVRVVVGDEDSATAVGGGAARRFVAASCRPPRPRAPGSQRKASSTNGVAPAPPTDARALAEPVRGQMRNGQAECER